MSTSSGLRGQCNVCAHSYNEHSRHRCNGRDKKRNKKGKYEYVKCTVYWYICQQGSHDFMGDRNDAYLVCHDCKSHPGGGPEGTGPDGVFPTADEAQAHDPGRLEWQWHPTYQRYYYIDNNGNPIWMDDQGQSSSSAQ